MLKKSDLAKQFELVVQQEIKNYQDSLNFILQSLRDLKDEIRNVHDVSLAKHASLHSLHCDMTIEFKALKEACLSLSLRFEKSLTDQRLVNERNQTQILDLSADVVQKINSFSSLQDKIVNIWIAINTVRDKSESNFRVLNDNADDLFRRFTNALSRTKTDILNAPTEASLVKTQLEEKIFSHTVDVSGIMKELNIYKKENYITQKKLENIYTLIERLQKSEVIP